MGENGGLTLLCVNHATQATYRKRELTVMMAVVTIFSLLAVCSI